uniref:Uncharacterized protein n=1 Tax=Ciona intestinalis TaxID=7719 RepID=H2XR19_CIOIN
MKMLHAFTQKLAFSLMCYTFTVMFIKKECMTN